MYESPYQQVETEELISQLNKAESEIERLRAEVSDLREDRDDLQATADAKDTARLDFLDNNSRMSMGWRVEVAPAGNISVTSVIQLGGVVTSIREAIDAARKGKKS